VEHAAGLGLTTIALTDHDSVDGCEEAEEAGLGCGVRVIRGCEFSVQAPWGELHLLSYFLPSGNRDLTVLLGRQKEMRHRRVVTIVERLGDLGVRIGVDDVLRCANGGAVGRPHVARAMVESGTARDVGDAFRRYLGANRPAFVPKQLPALEDVATMVRSLGGVTSAAHLRSRGTRMTLSGLKAQNVDAVEVFHPAHSDAVSARISALATNTGMLRTGGSDWHGEVEAENSRALLGGTTIPESWLKELDALHGERLAIQDTLS